MKPDRRPRIYQTKVSGTPSCQSAWSSPAHGHAAQPKHKPDGGMRLRAGRTRLAMTSTCLRRDTAGFVDRSVERESECDGRTLLSTSRCGRRRHRHFGVEDTIV